VRTTIRIDDELHRRVKHVADQSGRTIGQVIEDAIQVAFRPEPKDEWNAPLPIFGGSGVMPGIDPSSQRSAEDAMGEDTSLDALR
jgi:Ribbon-helix-helix protein, copG family